MHPFSILYRFKNSSDILCSFIGTKEGAVIISELCILVAIVLKTRSDSILEESFTSRFSSSESGFCLDILGSFHHCS